MLLLTLGQSNLSALKDLTLLSVLLQLELLVEKVCADLCCININAIDDFYAMHVFHIRYSFSDKHFSTGSC